MNKPKHLTLLLLPAILLTFALVLSIPCFSQDLTAKCGHVTTCSNVVADTFDPAMAYSSAPANLSSVDNARGVYGYQPDVFTLKNTSITNPIALTSVTVPTGYSADTNCYTGTTAHPLPYTLPVGSSCNLGVSYTPVDISPASGTIGINYTEPASGGANYTLSVAVANTTGTTAELTITNASVPAAIPAFYQATNGLQWNFPIVLPLTSQNTTFIVKNRGTTSATSLGVVIKEGNIADLVTATNFTLATNTCGTGAGSLAGAAA